jgi:hypothetical protein
MGGWPATDIRPLPRGAARCSPVARSVQGMHGVYRIPTLLKRVDRLARDA